MIPNNNGNDAALDEHKEHEISGALWRMFQQSNSMSRAMLGSRLGMQFGGDRDLYASFGYLQQPQYQDYRNLFDRQGLATRAVEKFANDTWNRPPVIIDGDARSDNEEKATPFLKGWNALSKRLKLWQAIRQADIMLGFSRYSVLFMGAPGEKFSEPAGNDGLFYIQAFDESQAGIASYIKDTKSSLYGMPENYNVSFNAVDAGIDISQGGLVHYTRVIHVAENKLSSRIYGRPRLQTVINRLFDLEKVTGGGAEAAWLSVFKGMLLLTRDGAELPAKGSQEETYLNEQITNFMHRIQRFATLSDVDVHDLGVDSINIGDIYGVLSDDFAGSLGIPKRILYGSERGELASSQDKTEWNGVIDSRRTNFAEPEVLNPVIDWCIVHKAVPAPASGSYSTEWAEVYPMSKKERVEYANLLAAGAASVTGGVPEEALDSNEWRTAAGQPARTPEQIQAIEEKIAEEQDALLEKKKDLQLPESNLVGKQPVDGNDNGKFPIRKNVLTNALDKLFNRGGNQ